MKDIIITIIIVIIILTLAHVYYAKKYLVGIWETPPDFTQMGYFIVCIDEDLSNCLFIVNDSEGQKIYEDMVEMKLSAISIPTIDGFHSKVTFTADVLPFDTLAECELHLNKTTGTIAFTRDDEIILALTKNLIASNS